MQDTVRLDKWLWAARFYKTRSLATTAVNGGKVKVNGVRAKPSKEIKIGFVVEVSQGPLDRTVTVQRLSEKRGPAKDALMLFEETPESVAAREARQLLLKADRAARPTSDGRPNKRERRQLTALKKQDDT